MIASDSPAASLSLRATQLVADVMRDEVVPLDFRTILSDREQRGDRAKPRPYLRMDVIGGTPYAENHLHAYLAAAPHLARRCLVQVDDTDILNGGKGRLVIPRLIRDGFELVAAGRQSMLVRG
jgi:hypothetical protein